MPIRRVITFVVGVALVAILAPAVPSGAQPATLTPPVPDGTVQPLKPARVLDTRAGLGAPKSAVSPGHPLLLQIDGRGGVPSTGVAAVLLNITATGASGSGYVRAYAQGATVPTTSSVNFRAGATVANLALARVGDGAVMIAVGGSPVQVIADVTGYIRSGARTVAGSVQPVEPARLLDTRNGTGAPATPVVTGHPVMLQVAGSGGVPLTGVSAVILNVTVAGARGSGYVRVYADDGPVPATSNVNYVANVVVGNLVVVPVGADGRVVLAANGGSTNLIADVSGYVRDGTRTVSGAVEPLAAARVLDTRSGNGAPRGTVSSGHSVALQVDGRGGVPASGVSAVVLNLTATGATSGGYVKAYADGTSPPTTSSLNYAAGVVVGNLVIAPVGADGKVALTVTGAATNLIADVSGYVRSHTAAWSNYQSVDPVRGQPTGLSCPSTTFCAAVDASGQALFFDGQRWTAPAVVDAADGFSGVSCVTATFCMGVDSNGQASRYDGADWSARVQILNITNSSASVSCASATFCVGISSGRAAVYDGVWAAPQQIDHSAGQLTSVSCPVAGYCMAADAAGQVFVYSSGEWSDPTTVFSGDLGPSGLISCVAADSCVVGRGRAVSTWDGASWSAPQDVVPATTGVAAVSCGTVDSCVVVDSQGADYLRDGDAWTAGPSTHGARGPLQVSCAGVDGCTLIDSSGFATRLVDGAWAEPDLVDLHAGLLQSVGCAGTAYCVAVDAFGASVTYADGRWSTPSLVARNVAFSAVACPAVDDCVGVGANSTVGTFDGTSWSVQVLPIVNEPFVAVSCSGAAFCAALALDGEVVTYDGSGWSAPVDVMQFDPPGVNHGASISCASGAYCKAVDETGDVWTLDGGSWTGPVAVTQRSYTGPISCVSRTFCRLAAAGRFATFDGSTWTDHSPTPQPYASLVGGGTLDCVSVSFCAASPATAYETFVYDGQSWDPADLYIYPPGDTVNQANSVSCVSTTLCVDVDAQYARVWS